MAKLQIDLSGRAGLAPRHWGDLDRTVSTPELRYIGSEGQMASGIYNPFRRYGYCSPSNSTFQTTGINTAATIGSTIYDRVNNNFYCAERSQKIFKGANLDEATSIPQALDLGTTGTPVLMDLEIYMMNGVRKLYYIYKTGGNLEVGNATLPFASANSNWLSTDTTGAFTNGLTNEAFMRVADNGFAYIFQDNNIHKIDGTTYGGANGTVTANVIQFPPFFQIVDAIDYRGNIYAAIHQDTAAIRGAAAGVNYNAPTGIYIWDRLSNVVNVRDYIPVDGISRIRKIYIAPNGELRLIGENSERVVEIRRFTGSSFEKIEEVGIGCYPQFPDSLDSCSSLVVWLGADGIIYAHGNLTHLDKEALYKIGNLPEAHTFTGAILFGGSTGASSTTGYKAVKSGFYIGYNVATPLYHFKAWDMYGTGADGVTAQQEQGDVYTLVKYLPQMSNVNYIDIYMFPGGDGENPGVTAGTVKIYFNQSSSAWASKVVTRGDSFNGYKRIEINKPYVNSIQLEVEFSTSTVVGAFDFAPSYAVVDYTPTTTKG